MHRFVKICPKTQKVVDYSLQDNVYTAGYGVNILPSKVKPNTVLPVGENLTATIYGIHSDKWVVLPYTEESVSIRCGRTNKRFFLFANHIQELIKTKNVLTPKLSNALKKEVRDSMRTKASRCCVASYATISGKGITYNPDDVCHARALEASTVNVAIYDYHHEVKERLGNKKALMDYRKVVRYVLQQSPWSKLFHSRCVDSFIEKGVFIRTDFAAEYVMQGIMALRMSRERRERNEIFAHLIGKGVNPHVAYIFMMSFQPSEAKGKYILSIPMSHTPFSQQLSLKKYSNFCKGVRRIFSRTKMAMYSNSWHINALFDVEGNEPDALRTELGKLLTNKGEVGKREAFYITKYYSLKMLVEAAKKMEEKYGF